MGESMKRIPQVPESDSTIELLKNPYTFISSKARALKSDVFQGNILFEKVTFMTGKEAAELFVDEALFTRKGAAPEIIKSTLFGRGGVQLLDGEEHFHRKKVFVSVMDPLEIEKFVGIFLEWLDIYAKRWEALPQVKLYPELQEILTRSVCEWADIQLPEKDVSRRTKELSDMFDGSGSLSRHLSARISRLRAQSWAKGLIEDCRRKPHAFREGSPVKLVAFHKDLMGNLLPLKTAAVELLNVLRPSVAVSVYLVFCVHALAKSREDLERLRFNELGELDRFVQEVRRDYPFFPSLVARSRRDFEWKGYHFEKGRRFVLDLYGTNHDARDWQTPKDFSSDRFRSWSGSGFSFIPQGGGDHAYHHRCPGELLTIELMRAFSEFMVHRLSYEVPGQDLDLDLSRLPALPRSQMIIGHVQRKLDRPWSEELEHRLSP
jgi:fatty-acid peroxygenase